MFSGCFWAVSGIAKGIQKLFLILSALWLTTSYFKQSALQWSCLITVSIGDQRCCGLLLVGSCGLSHRHISMYVYIYMHTLIINVYICASTMFYMNISYINLDKHIYITNKLNEEMNIILHPPANMAGKSPIDFDDFSPGQVPQPGPATQMHQQRQTAWRCKRAC